MISSTIDHRLVPSFQEYINWKILDKGRAFSIVSTGFYKQTGIRNTSVVSYASPYKSFVYDSGISGVVLMTGVSGNGTFINKGVSGLTIDYMNGRVLFTTDPNFSQVSGTFTLKDINIKYSTKSVEELLMNTKYVKQPIGNQVVTGLSENVETYPIIFVNYTPGENKPRALGGMDETKFYFNCLCVMDNHYTLDGVLSILRDLNNTEVGIFENNEIPINISGDLKGNYTYTGTMASKAWPNAFHIEEVSVLKLPPETNNEFGQNIYIGEAEFSCGISRFPRQ